MYIDDIVSFSECITNLQKMIDTVNLYSNKYNLCINLSKSKNVDLGTEKLDKKGNGI